MKRNILAVLLAAALPLSAHAAASSYTLQPAHSYAHFAVNHMGFSTVHGRFDKTSGKFTLDTAAKSGSLDVSIDVGSVSTGFAKRDEHLRSPDFFNAVEFPAITYKSTKVVFKGDEPASVEGNLTIHGVTKPVTLTIDAFKCGPNPMSKKDQCGADAHASIKRSDFDMKAFLPGIGDDIKLTFDVEADKD